MEDRTLPSFPATITIEMDGTALGGLGPTPSLVADQEFTLSAEVSGFTAPTGTVEIEVDSNDLGTFDLTSGGGTWSYSAPLLLRLHGLGIHTLTIIYGGDDNFLGGTATAPLTIVGSSVPGQTVVGDSSGSPGGPVVPTTGAPGPAMSDADVFYGAAGIEVVQNDLADSSGYGLPYSETWTYSNITGSQDPGSISGTGGTQSQWPHLLELNSTANEMSIAMVINSSNRYFFDQLGTSAFATRYGYNLTMTETTIDGDNAYVVTDGIGDVFDFYAFSDVPSNCAGELFQMTSAGGDTTTVESFNSAGSPTEVEQSNGAATNQYVSTYISSGTNEGLLQSVTESTQVGDGSWVEVAYTDFTYYDGTTDFGNANEMRTALTYDPDGNLMDGYYYRYYTGDGADSGMMEYAFSTAAYERLVGALGGSLDSLTNEAVAPYATDAYEYNESGGVSEATIAGQGTFQYSYTTNSDFSDDNDPNVWLSEAVETLPDGNENIVFTNDAGQPMLSIYEDTTTDQQWCTYYKYDSSNQLILEAAPSAVTGYSSSYNDLVGWSGGSAAYLSSDGGLITTNSYTTEADGYEYLQESYVKQGTGGTAVPQASYTYASNTAGGVTIYPLASETLYQSTGGEGAETTSYSYSYYSESNQAYSVTTTLPVVSTDDNGSGSANSTTTFYSPAGQPTWTKDPDGYISYTAYDPATGAVIEQITDVNTSDSGDFSDLPSGWSTITGGGLNLVTTYEVDAFGRVTEMTNPDGNITYIVYDDADNEVRSYPGWNVDTNTPTGPTEVYIDDMAAGYTETLTMSAAPAVTDGVPTGTESIADVQSLSRSYTNDEQQVIEIDDYFSLGGLSYSSGSMGTSGVNYYPTYYGYNADGLLDMTEDAQGTINITVYDGQGREVSTWVGTDDTPESGTWSPTNNSSPCNMVETESFVYDGAAVGDGNLTQTIQYPGGDAPERVTDYWYDWRDRLVAEKDGVSEDEDDGVNRPLTVYSYDNLGEVIETQVYNGDGITPTLSDGELSLPDGASSDLQAETVTSYDSQGQVYQTQVYSVTPTDGDVSDAALTTENYYDPDGQLIATSAPGGLWTKDVYNGAGEVVTEYQTDGGSGTSYSEAGSVSSDLVLTQTQYVYDADGNTIETITKDRFGVDSTLALGALGTAASGVHAVIYYEGYYYDAAGRLTADVNVGDNGYAAWTMPDSPPSRSDDVLETTYSFAADAVQDVALTGTVTGGTFTLTFDGHSTSSIAYNASDSTVQSDLAALASVGSGNVVVTTALGGGWEIRFTGSLAGEYQNQMTASGSGLTGSGAGIAVSTLSLGGDAGNVSDTVDPDDIDTRQYYNPLGEVVQEVQDFTTGAITDSSNKTTDYTYNSVGMTSLTAETGGGHGETTEWVYGVTTGTGSDIDSNDIVSATEQPNPSTGAPDSSIETKVTVDALGETLTSTDPDGTTHTYVYDVLGQQIADEVTTLGSGVDGSVMEIGTTYTTLGDPQYITTFSAVGGSPYAIVNQVYDVYNGLDQFTQEYQSVSGMVETSGDSITPSVQYTYTDITDGNNSRLTSIVYPDGYTVDYNYASGLDNDISRLSYISDDTGTLQSYEYLGLSTIVVMDEPEADIELTYMNPDDPGSDSGDIYPGLDRFGRVDEQNWYNTSTDASIVDIQYGYDDDGNVLYQNNTLESSQSELFTYDDLGQLTSFERGTLSDDDTEIASPSISETWGYDPLGNHLTDSTTTTGTVTITSTFNYDNQIASISSGTTPTYDADGNMTTDQNGLSYTYNAWGEVVDVYSGDTLEENYTYDGFGDRMTNTVYTDDVGTTTNLYNSSADQVLEEQAASTGYYTTRYVWSVAYVNQMVDRDTDTSGTGLTPTGSGYARAWPLADADYNTVALVIMSGGSATVVERYAYDPFGAVTYMDGSYGSLSASAYAWVYLFQGGRLDGVTSDTHFDARDVNSALGTWTSHDPLGFGGGDQVLYGFEGNGPVNGNDPTGLFLSAAIKPIIVAQSFDPQVGLNGFYFWGATFLLHNPAGKKGGFIVQHVIRKVPGEKDKDYWEAFRVEPGVYGPAIYLPPWNKMTDPAGNNLRDTLRARLRRVSQTSQRYLGYSATDWYFGIPTPGIVGVVSVSGSVFFVDDTESLPTTLFFAPGAPGSEPSAINLPSAIHSVSGTNIISWLNTNHALGADTTAPDGVGGVQHNLTLTVANGGAATLNSTSPTVNLVQTPVPP